MVLAAIIACEIGFWVAVLGGLAARYLARRPRLGAVLLIAAPLIDLLLLILVTVDLLNGSTASWHHGLAAPYIGVSVAYGHRMIAWADVRFAHRFDGGAAPTRLDGAAYTAACWRDVGRTLVAALVAAGLLAGLIVVVGEPDRTAELESFFGLLALIVGIDLLWAVSYTLWPRRPVAST